MKEKIIAIVGGIGGGVVGMAQTTVEQLKINPGSEGFKALYMGALGALGGLLIKELFTIVKKQIRKWKS